MGERPVRLQLSCRKGFDLQAVSRAANGLPAFNVARPGKWGNPFVVTDKMRPGVTVDGAYGYVAVPTVEDAVECFAEMMSVESGPGTRSYELRARLHELRGHNLACWCALPEPGKSDCCHAIVLMDMANA